MNVPDGIECDERVRDRVPALALLLLIAIFTAGCCLPATRQPPPHETISVMSFNIRYGTASDGDNVWRNRTELVFNTIERHDPDILGLQEALAFQLDAIRSRLSQYDSVGVGRRDGKRKGEFSALLFKRDRFESIDSGTFWLSDEPETPGSKSWGNSITRICTWTSLRERASGRVLHVYNTHLDHQSQPSRERSTALIAARIAARSADVPRMLMGDFNAGEDNAAIDTVRRSGLKDSFRTAHPTVTEVGTFNGFKGTADGEKIDYVFVSDDWQVLEAAIVRHQRDGRFPSDHFPVTALVKLQSIRSRAAPSPPTESSPR